MALACEPELLIADEPTTALDVTIQAQILDLLHELKDEFRTSIMLITHDMGVVATVCSKVIIMYGGLVMESGTVEEVFYEPKHPYTKALLKAIPSLDLKEGERLQSIPGLPPSLIDPPKDVRSRNAVSMQLKDVKMRNQSIPNLQKHTEQCAF